MNTKIVTRLKSISPKVWHLAAVSAVVVGFALLAPHAEAAVCRSPDGLYWDAFFRAFPDGTCIARFFAGFVSPY